MRIIIILLFSFGLMYPQNIQKALYKSIKEGNLKNVERLYEVKHADINEPSKNGNSALMMAAYYGKYDIVKYLLSKNVGINSINNRGWSALMYAIDKNNVQIAKFLLENKANINQKDLQKNTPFTIAVKNDNLEIVKILIQKGFKIKNPKDIFLFACIYGAVNFLNYGLSNKLIQLDKTSGPVIEASIYNRVKVLKLLKSLGSDFLSLNSKGQNALTAAAKKGNLASLKFLIDQAGVNVDAKDSSGHTAIMYAIENSKKKVFDYLISKKSNLKAEAKDGNLPIMIATNNPNTYYLSKILSNGININIKNSKGITPLMAATINDNHKTMRYILSKGGDKKIKNKKGKDSCDLSPTSDGYKLLKC